MKTKYLKVAHHIRRLNDLLGILNAPTYSEGTAVTIDLLLALKKLEDKQHQYAFTSNAVDHAIAGRTEADF